MTMKRSGMALLLAFGTTFPAGAAGDGPAGLEPYQIVRSLELPPVRLNTGQPA